MTSEALAWMKQWRGMGKDYRTIARLLFRQKLVPRPVSPRFVHCYLLDATLARLKR